MSLGKDKTVGRASDSACAPEGITRQAESEFETSVGLCSANLTYGYNLPELPTGWEYVPLENCARSNSISYGVVQPGLPVINGIPIVRVNNFRDTRIDVSEIMKISSEVEAKYSRTRLEGGEVLLTLVGSVGQVAVVPKNLKGFNVARAVGVIHPHSDISPEWIAICLRSELSQHILNSRANTTVQTMILPIF